MWQSEQYSWISPLTAVGGRVFAKVLRAAGAERAGEVAGSRIPRSEAFGTDAVPMENDSAAVRAALAATTNFMILGDGGGGTTLTK